jgi:hypothetical protein
LSDLTSFGVERAGFSIFLVPAETLWSCRSPSCRPKGPLAENNDRLFDELAQKGLVCVLPRHGTFGQLLKEREKKERG